MHRVVGATLGLAVATALKLAAQATARPEDVRTIDGIMKAYYEVVSGPKGAIPDEARDQTLHHPKAQVTLIDRKADGTTTARVGTLADYYAASGRAPRKEPFYEKEIHRVTQRIGSVLHVWSTYESRREPNGKPFTRGINSIQLYWDGARWWILGWVFDSEVHGVTIPAEYLPKQ